jgi:Tol biopolymer transport system component
VPRTASGWGEPEHLPPEINDALSQPDVLVAPDGSWLIVAVTDHPRGLGGDDLFLTRRTTRGWTPLEHIPAPINSAEYEYGPSLTADGRSLLFTSHRRGTADIYVIPLSALGLDPAR